MTRRNLEDIARKNTCLCGYDLSVAYQYPYLVLYCKLHGYSPPLKLRDTRGLIRLFEDGEQLDVHEANALRLQLLHRIGAAESAGKRPNPRYVRLYERFERMREGATE